MTTKAFVIGHPIAHSKSPLIHGTWLEAYGVEGSYTAFDIAPEDLPDFLARIRAGEFAGGNVTIPHKEAVMALCDTVDPLARRIGAVNTLVHENGALLGRNTDYLGFLANLDAGAPGWDAALESVIVLGAGGAARAIIVALLERGAARIDLLNRSPARAETLAAEFGPRVVPGVLEDFASRAPSAALLVNTTSIGMGGSAFENLDLAVLPPHAVVSDIVYTPLITPLLASAQARGLHIVDGLGMLLHQAAPGFEAWFGVRPVVTDALRASVLKALG